LPDVAQTFDIPQPVERVWALFQDVPQVVTCMPGLELTGQTGADAYQGKVRLRLGPVTAAFEGEAIILERDAVARQARIAAKGVDRKGGSRASAAIVYTLATVEGGTRVTLAGDIKLTGALAQIGRTGIIQDVAAQLTAQFAEALRAKLAASAVEPAASPSNPPPLAGGERGGGASPGPEPLPPAAPASGGGNAEVSATRFLLAVLWRRIKRLFGAQ
jgi:carbon monoxide dehydrogenase subunit G